MLAIRVQQAPRDFALDVAFDAPTPGVVALFGASGSGKTTVIDADRGPDPARRGRASRSTARSLFDVRAASMSRPSGAAIGYVFQDARLLPAPSVEGNLRYGERRARPTCA